MGMGGKSRRREKAAPDEGRQTRDEPIVYPKFTCRECGGDCPVYKTEGRVRRHSCKDCGHTFKSVEQEIKG